jgi:hypothetical protein
VSVGVGLQVVRLVISGTFKQSQVYNINCKIILLKMVFFLCVWVRLHIDRDSAYLFLTRSIEKSRELLSTLKVFDSYATNDNFSLER